MEAAGAGDVVDALRAGSQQLAGILDALLAHVVAEGRAHQGLEDVAQVALGEEDLLADLRQGQVFIQMGLDVGAGFFDVGVAGLRGFQRGGVGIDDAVTGLKEGRSVLHLGHVCAVLAAALGEGKLLLEETVIVQASVEGGQQHIDGFRGQRPFVQAQKIFDLALEKRLGNAQMLFCDGFADFLVVVQALPVVLLGGMELTAIAVITGIHGLHS